MYRFIVISVLLTTASSTVLGNFNVLHKTYDVKTVQQNYETFLETVPDSLKEDAHLLVPELIQKYGYPCERHTVISKDGYILELHRIPYGKDGPSENRPAVFVQHGLLSSSADWVIPGPEKGLPHVLVDHGYDVWLANARGNRYSRKHVTLHPRKDAKKFWNFSWHEIALDDVPTGVDYVRNITNQDKIFYIGHSQGTTVSYVMLSRMAAYNDKFRAVFTLAPSAYAKRAFSPLVRIISKFEKSLGFIANVIGLHEFAPRTEFVAQVGPILCGEESPLQILCINSLFAVCGFNYKQINTTLLPVFLGHTPAGAATKQLLHYAQLFNSGKFREWDYGMLGNLRHYGRLTPPDYVLKNVKAPLYIYYSGNDWLSNVQDVEQLASEVGNLQGKFMVLDKKFNHLDYVMGIDAPNLVYKRIISLMGRH
ncbi:hypothetical protein ILUMI_16335 [Ignelater luminosus]|uniref:Lipase n=1 Tax=Ignelater luminosus TaxID=2038154 RepID=A0A8K0CLZ6_IGNLU|nr:hypothetical protein ILUMI_16335 [Ignelater luminosus]